MALDMLAQAFEREESQTMTMAMKYRDDNSDGSDIEDTVIGGYEETIIQNDAYIDHLIHTSPNIEGPRYSESMTVTTNVYNTTHNFTGTPTPLTANPNPSLLTHQKSNDSLLVLEHFQDQIAEKEKENIEIKSKLKRQKTQNEGLLKQNNDLNQKIKKLAQKKKENQILVQANQDLEMEIEQMNKNENEMKNGANVIQNELNLKTEALAQKNSKINKLNMELQALKSQNEQNNNMHNELVHKDNEIGMLKGKIIELMHNSNGNGMNREDIDVLNNSLYEQNIVIQSLYKQIEDYEVVNEWLRYQMKWDTFIAVSNNKVTVEALEQWKNSLGKETYEKRYSDNQQGGDDDEKENVNDKVKQKQKAKKDKVKKKVKKKVDAKMYGRAESEANDDEDDSRCYYAWFFK